MDHSPFKLNIHFAKKSKSFTTARKSMLKLVKLPSLVAKCCKIRKKMRLRSLQILYTFVLRLPQNGRLPVNFRHFVVSVIQKYTKFANSQAYIFRILQHFATKLGNFTNFNMLFLAVVKDFDFVAKMMIQFKRGIVH